MTAMTAEAMTFVEEFADQGAVESELLYQYLDRYRKVPVGPSVSLAFENANTLAFRVTEVQKLRRVYPAATVQRMLGFYASLLPGPFRLCAAVSVRRPGRRPTAGLNTLGDAVTEGTITFRIGGFAVVGEVMPTRASDRTLGPAFWVSFNFDDASRAALEAFSNPATIGVDAEGYDWESEPLSYDVRRSLCEDFTRPY